MSSRASWILARAMAVSRRAGRNRRPSRDVDDAAAAARGHPGRDAPSGSPVVDVRRLVADGAQLVEVLPEDEYAEAHLPGAINIPITRLGAETTTSLDERTRRRRAPRGPRLTGQLRRTLGLMPGNDLPAAVDDRADRALVASMKLAVALGLDRDRDLVEHESTTALRIGLDEMDRGEPADAHHRITPRSRAAPRTRHPNRGSRSPARCSYCRAGSRRVGPCRTGDSSASSCQQTAYPARRNKSRR
jgi:rhodanese-related sulfurtransferase